ncbi:MAG: type III pantothenate kinase [Cellvibrionaceae bacterium]|jgi:type III pantothenate kinase
MLLAIDIGNTNIVLGVWDGQEWLTQWRLRTVPNRTADELGIHLRSLVRDTVSINKLDRIVLASVVPALTPAVQDACKRYLHLTPLLVTSDLDLGIINETDVPSLVGADRLANVAAAHHLAPPRTAVIVVDMGTATKLDVVTSDGRFPGGVIAPGLGITSDALFSRAAKLSQVELLAPPTVIGRNTVHAIQSGLVNGYAVMLEGLLPRLIKEIKELDSAAETVHIIGTGGLITIIDSVTNILDIIDPWLTLKGLQLIADRN